MNLAITVEGRVQGVFFRASTRDKAIELGLKGFVRNEKDGSVYIEVEGEHEKLQEFLSWCNNGPKHAKVELVKAVEGRERGFVSFEISRE